MSINIYIRNFKNQLSTINSQHSARDFDSEGTGRKNPPQLVPGCGDSKNAVQTQNGLTYLQIDVRVKV
jgi:hypothetical protein